ncbi:hypothetical protein SAMN05518801_10458 [Novosphingobium sp. CF614]|uniref:hypothetical protein n=1 Tax=Novosphingobium sp. CF614 TaxID=1884364 RepID=UPI0008E26C4F|nr:hypothetical protein [Novosphingobium sp. CF614]SFF94653.1 hypothetical protein SAMN05518801_10458 [Novosphingobium sp. CF614]
MLSKINPSAVVAQCWYMRRHVPEGRRWREADGAVHCTCRYCQRPIRSRGGGRWDLAEGFDLDALAESGRTSHFCVIDALDDMVIARYPLSNGADEQTIAARLAEICAIHGIEDSNSVLEVRLVQTRGGLRRVH